MENMCGRAHLQSIRDGAAVLGMQNRQTSRVTHLPVGIFTYLLCSCRKVSLA